MQYLLKQKNIDIDFQSEPLQYSALQVCTMTGNFEILELLLEQGAEPNNPNKNSKTPLITCFIKELPQEYTFENQRVSYKMA
ncbi:MAG: ankyrin repeat domain-containing protein [bacterium]